MNKMLKSLAVGLVMMLLVMTPSMGDEISKELNLENLEELIKISSIDIEKAKTDVTIAEYKLEIAEDNKGLGSNSFDIQKSNKYDIDEAEMNLAYAISSKEDIISNTILDGKIQIYTYLIKEKEKGLLNSKSTRLNEDLSNIKKRVELGLDVTSSIESKELEIQKVELEIKSLEIEMSNIQLTLNQYLRWDLETTINILDTELPTLKELSFDLSDIKDYQLLNNYELVKLKEVEDLATEYLNVLKATGVSDSEDSVTDAKVAMEDADYARKDKELNVEMNVYSTYNSLLNFKDTVFLNELEVINASNNYNRLVKRFEVGFETSSAVNAAKENVDFAVLALEKAELDYYIAYERFSLLGDNTVSE